ncbi:MAG: TetR/AcrR family transcriptional regulator [Actinomycetota bacterium]|nr:TetR/AcrR family transcriptional regulator [Actinomycetota bacterium]
MVLSATASATRPRVEGERATEIHQAVVDLLVEFGYDKLTFDAVATRARVGKATLYRKWSGKAALVVDAIAETICPDRVDRSDLLDRPDSGTLRGDLVSVACQDGGLTSGLSELLGAVMPALHRDAELMSEFTTRFLEPMTASAVEVFSRAQRRGEIGPDADLHQLASILPAMSVHRAVVFGKDTDLSTVVSIVDKVVLPACRATLV